MITHPRRADVPIFLGAEGPKNVALATEIADGWVPLYYSPYRPEVYETQMKAAKPGFEVAVNVFVQRRRRRRHRALAGEGDARLLHRRHGGEVEELPHRADGPDGLRGAGLPDPGAVLRRQARRGDRGRPRRVRRRDLARRPEGAHRRATRRLARHARDHDPARRPGRHDHARHGRAHARPDRLPLETVT